jgi:Ca2+-binding RTX toxin-like protein
VEGGDGTDTLQGDAGTDTLVGGRGADILRGGAGVDQFVLVAPADSARAAPDRLMDFVPAQADKLDLHLLDANSALLAGNQAFTFIGTNAFSAAGQVRYAVVGGDTRVEGDLNGDRVADFMIVLDPVVALKQEDFLL